MEYDRAKCKKQGAGGIEGMDYQLNVMLHVLLQVTKLELTNFRLFAEYVTAGKFDDIVLIYEDENKKERSCLLQAKHVIDESKTVSFNDLISGDKFNLEKYFDSFKEIIQQDQFKDSLEHLILFTNLNISKGLLPYVEEVETLLPIWNCQPVEGNEKKPQLYKLNSKFIDEYQYSQLRVLSNVIIDYCVKNNEMKHTNNNFKDCHVLLTSEVFNVEEKCFRKEFIEGEHLLQETQIFRNIFEEEIQKRENIDGSCLTNDTLMWQRDQKLKFSVEFGQSSSKSKEFNSWPVLLKNDEKESFKIFCSFLILGLKQPNDREIEECLTRTCSEYFDNSLANMAKGELKFRIREWFKADEGSPLTCQFLDDAIEYIKNNAQEVTASNVSRNEITELLSQKTEFETLSLMSDIEKFMTALEKRLLLIITENTELSSMKNIFCLSKLNHEYLFTSKSNLRELRGVFNQSLSFNLLVWHHLANSRTVFEQFLYQLSDLLWDIKDKSKKIIVIISESISAFQLEVAEDMIQQINDETQFGHLTEDTRQKLLKRKVSFQGYDMEVEKIVGECIQLDQLAHDSWGGLSSNGNILIGQKVNLSQEYNSDYYIQRTIVVTSMNTRKEQSLNEREFIQHALLEDQSRSLKRNSDPAASKVDRKLFIVSDPAGMGKTTVSSSLADEIKRSHPHFWVTRLVAMECASDLNNFDESTTSDVTYVDFFMSELLKFSSPLERFVFGQYLKNGKSLNKFIIIFDGYDEINKKCQRVIIKILQYLGRQPNVGFMVITTRPQCKKDFEKYSNRSACILKPFDDENKIEFLRRYWTSRGIAVNSKRLTKYAEQLIKSISRSITETESQLTGIPLQMRMIAEIYEEEAHRYVKKKSNNFNLNTMSIGLFDLYENFMKIKEKICLNIKLEDKGSAFITKMIKSVQQHQSRFAREIILKRSDVSKVEVSDLEGTTQLGIIQQNQEGDFYFIHRTFAEFLTAKYLLEEIIEKDSVPAADKIKNGLLIKQILDDSLYVVRKLINSKLNGVQLAEECKRSEDKAPIQKLLGDEFQKIIVNSAREGNSEFFKLTIEVNCWLQPQQIFSKLKDSIMQVEIDSKASTAILDCMIDKWLPSKDNILIKTIDFLIRYILVSDDENGYASFEFQKSTIDYQTELEKGGMLKEEELKNILSDARDDVVNRGKYWNFHSTNYLLHLHSTHRNLFYTFLNDNRPLLHALMEKGLEYKFLLWLQRDEEVDANWVFHNFIENQFNGFKEWEDDHFKLYFSILQSSAGQFHAERKTKFRNYLEHVIHICYQQSNLLWEGLYSKFLKGYEEIISLDEIISKFVETKTAEDLEYCALWGETEKLKEILQMGNIEGTAVVRFQLYGGTEDLAATRRRLLNSSKERQGGEEELLEWIGQRNRKGRTILLHALEREDDLNIEIISAWITTSEVFEKVMERGDNILDYISEFGLYLNFVNEKFPQYRLRFLEIHKNIFIGFEDGREAIFRMIENDENMSPMEFVQILKLQMDRSFFDGTTILHAFVHQKDIGILKKWLNLIKKFSLDSETITQLFSIKDKRGNSPLHEISNVYNYCREILTHSSHAFCV